MGTDRPVNFPALARALVGPALQQLDTVQDDPIIQAVNNRSLSESERALQMKN